MVKKWNSVPNAIAKCKYTESSISVPHFPQVKSSKVTVLQYIFIFFADLGKSCSDVSASKKRCSSDVIDRWKGACCSIFSILWECFDGVGDFSLARQRGRPTEPSQKCGDGFVLNELDDSCSLRWLGWLPSVLDLVRVMNSSQLRWDLVKELKIWCHTLSSTSWTQSCQCHLKNRKMDAVLQHGFIYLWQILDSSFHQRKILTKKLFEKFWVVLSQSHLTKNRSKPWVPTRHQSR